MANDPIFGFVQRDCIALRELLDAYRRGELRGAVQQPRRPQGVYYGGEFGKANAAIAATTVGSTVISHGACTYWTFSDSTGHSVSATTEIVEGYNLSTVAVSTGSLLQFKRHVRTGLMLIDFESCT